jgi:AGZA family xanthine/uracil permease-like MFS transporter
MTAGGYRWATRGDINAFFALFLDNMVNLFVLSAILTGFGMPKEFVYTRILPGTAIGVMVGDLLYSWMAFRLAKRSGRKDVTAMPLGLDMPSTVAVAYAVMFPAFTVFYHQTGDAWRASELAWYIGMASTIWMAAFKFFGAFLGRSIQNLVPAAGLVGSLAGTGLVWLGAHALFGIYETSYVGLVSLVIILFTLVARHKFPFDIPGAAAAVIVGTSLYYLLGAGGIVELLGGKFGPPSLDGFGLNIPLPAVGGFEAVFGGAISYLPITAPFAIIVFTASVNVTEAARLAGDDYNSRNIILADSFATLVGGLLGGLAQSAPYFGHAAYKRMGARAAYTLATGITVGLGGIFGFIGFLVELIPGAVVKPILILIGFDMVRLSFQLTPRRHIMAVILAITPAIFHYCFTHLKNVYTHVQSGAAYLRDGLSEMQKNGVEGASALLGRLEVLLPPQWLAEFALFGALGQGFILIAMIWGSVAAFIIDRKIVRAAATLAIAAVFSLFGIIHSVFPNGSLYLPWRLQDNAGAGIIDRARSFPFEFASAYLLAAVTLLVIYYAGPARKGKGPVLDYDESVL